jgi:hypothetical protein
MINACNPFFPFAQEMQCKLRCKAAEAKELLLQNPTKANATKLEALMSGIAAWEALFFSDMKNYSPSNLNIWKEKQQTSFPVQKQQQYNRKRLKQPM